MDSSEYRNPYTDAYYALWYLRIFYLGEELHIPKSIILEGMQIWVCPSPAFPYKCAISFASPPQ
jgi:hypothetical protein